MVFWNLFAVWDLYLLSISVQGKALKPGKAIYPQISQMDADEKIDNSGLV
jgi:hypothetical protein